MRPKSCQVCGVEYLPTGPTQKWCLVCGITERKRRFARFEKTKTHPCLDCRKPVGRRAERCTFCAQEHRIGQRSGPDSVHWKGGRSKTPLGYIEVLVPREERRGRRYRHEHIVVWEKTHGMPVPKGWVVHHLNHIKDDNRPENLEAIPRNQHNYRHGEQRILELEAEVARLRALLGE